MKTIVIVGGRVCGYHGAARARWAPAAHSSGASLGSDYPVSRIVIADPQTRGNQR